MVNLPQERIGEGSILLGGVLWALFPVLTILTYSGLEPITALAWTTLLSLGFFFVVALVRNSWTNIFKKEILLPLLFVALITGIIFYLLYFSGLKYTSAGNAAIVATLEIFFTYMFFNVWRKEYIDVKHIMGAVLMLISAIVILSPNFTHFQIGDFLVLGAVCIAPVGNLFQKRLRSHLNSEQILFYRTLIATPTLFLLAHLFGENVIVPPANIWIIMLINGIILFGLTKILWIEGIFRISVTKAISISSISPVFTLIFAYFLLKDTPTLVQLIAIPFAVAGIYLLTRTVKIKS